MAPCLLILEDLDSLIDDRNRSFFLNELDGFESNVCPRLFIEPSSSAYYTYRTRMEFCLLEAQTTLIASTQACPTVRAVSIGNCTSPHHDMIPFSHTTNSQQIIFAWSSAFNDPSLSERLMYCQYWKKKLASNETISFPKSLVEHITSITDGFSFAYLKEALCVTHYLS